jgi:MFS family permease
MTPAPEGNALPGEASPRSPRGALAGLSLAMLLSALGTSIANVSLPTLVGVFGATFQQVQWVVLAYLLAVTALIVSVGRLGDLVGRRRLLLGGIGVFTAASVLGGAVSTLWGLIAARAVQGLGAAAMMALAMALVGEIVPKDRTGRAMGLLGTMSAIGTALGPSLGGLLIAAAGWRSIFLVNAPLGLVAWALVKRHLPADAPRATRTRAAFDRWGTLLLVLALAAYALALTLGRGRFGPLNLALLAGAAGLGAMFVSLERRIAQPLVRLGLLADRPLRAGLLTSVLVSTVMMATLVVGPFYLSAGLGLGPAAVGFALSVGPLVAAVMGVPAGRLADRLGAGRVTLLGLGGLAGGTLILAALPAPCGMVGYLAPIVVVTLAYALFQTANNTAVLRDVAADQRGVIAGLLNLSRNLGLITGAALMGAVFAFATRAADIATAGPAAVAAGMRATFALAAVFMVLAAVLAARARADHALVAARSATAS